MSKEIIITLVLSLLGSSSLAIFVTKFFERSRSKAEIQNINISGELDLGHAWQKYALQQQSDVTELRDRIEALEKKVENLKLENNLLWNENNELRLQLKKYQTQSDIKIGVVQDEMRSNADQIKKT